MKLHLEEETEAEFRLKAQRGSRLLLRRLRIHHDAPEIRQPAPPPRQRGIAEWVMLRAKRTESPIEQIKLLAASYYRITRSEIDLPCRRPDMSDARQLAMFIAHEDAGMTYADIGRAFGHVDHTSALHAKRKLDADPAFVEPIRVVRAAFADVRGGA